LSTTVIVAEFTIFYRSSVLARLNYARLGHRLDYFPKPESLNLLNPADEFIPLEPTEGDIKEEFSEWHWSQVTWVQILSM
jgi:hypothetical protein